MKNKKLRLVMYFLLLVGIQVGVWFILTKELPGPFYELIMGVTSLFVSKRLNK